MSRVGPPSAERQYSCIGSPRVSSGAEQHVYCLRGPSGQRRCEFEGQRRFLAMLACVGRAAPRAQRTRAQRRA
eukprot:11464960-Alexandrium_andersonii.AAC.1